MNLAILKRAVLLFCLVAVPAFSQTPQPFYADGSYDAAVQSPDDFLGFVLGSRPARAHEMHAYFRYLADTSPKASLIDMGRTWENRPLIVLLVSSESHMKNIQEIQKDMANLGDPRSASRTQADQWIKTLPAVAWMMYNVHGNELSGGDAALQLAYQLTAGTDQATLNLLENLIVGIDPIQNPDGRERTLAQVEQWTGQVMSHDTQSMEHNGPWPGGRANHYLFDLNRDWFIGSQIETRAKVNLMATWNPQLVVDAHEMGSFSTFYFNPPREPISDHIPPEVRKWWDIFAADQARAFDQYQWSYYTNDSFDEWYPGYGSSWAFGMGSVSILYEQARTAGSAVMRPEGRILSYREAVHHQFVSSIANLSTASQNRQNLLQDFYNCRVRAVNPEPGAPRAFVLLEGGNPTRAAKLADNLINQGLKVLRLRAKATFGSVQTFWNGRDQAFTAPAGSYVIPMDQPLSHLALSILQFDVRMNNRLLAEERKYLEEGKGTRMYEVGAWSMPMAYGVNALTVMEMPKLQLEPYTPPAAGTGIQTSSEAGYGYLIPYTDDAAITALLKLFDRDIRIRSAAKPFTLDGKDYQRGTLLIRRHENSEDLEAQMAKLTTDIPLLETIPVSTALTQKGINLGNESFELLEQPRTALLTGSGVGSTSFGALWHLLDAELKMRVALLDIEGLGYTDLRKYNVIILPSARAYQRLLGKNGLDKLQDWVSDGGTLIAVGDASAALADSTMKLSQVRLRRSMLKKLNQYDDELQWEAQAGHKTPDSLTVWSNALYKAPVQKKEKDELKAMTALDRRNLIYMPRGAFLRINLNPEHWLGFGVEEKIPALVYTDKVFLSKRPVQTAARFADEKEIRLSGLVWPEARARWANSAYATREGRGNGQVILFAGDPIFRGYTYGTARLLINAILLGPGLGARPAVQW